MNLRWCLNCLLLFSLLLLGLAFTDLVGVDLTKQKATNTSIHIALYLIPLYLLALGMQMVFYKQFHVWKKEGVSVGFVYDENLKDLEQEGFRGSWTNHCEREEDTMYEEEVAKDEEEVT